MSRARCHSLACRLLVAVPLLLPLGFLSPTPAFPQAACDDFSGFANCPPPLGRCLLGPDPTSCAQDCSTCTPGIDDDGDCVSDEEILDERDDDGDGLVDEDISCLNTCDPLTFACPTTSFPNGDLTVPSPVAGVVTLPARAAHWTCAGSLEEAALEVALEPDPVRPERFCGGYVVRIRLQAAAGGETYFEGPAVLVHTRRFESLDSSLVAGSQGNVQVFRYVLRADLSRIAPFDRLPAALQVPCNADTSQRRHLFLYGHLDVARDSTRPDDRSFYRTSLALAHAPGAMSHPEASYNPALELCGVSDVSKRPIARGLGAAHDDAGLFVVAPGPSFTFSSAAPILTGSFQEGRIRLLPEGPGDCRRETRACESQFTDPGPAPACAARIVHRRVRFCGQDDGTTPCPHYNLVSATKCATIPGDRLAFLPVGSWDAAEYPAKASLSFVEGALICRDNFHPYWYGVYTEMASPGLWPGPERALDVVDNQVLQLTGLGEWLLGSVNWLDEGGPNERFAPRQFRTMYFFPSINPDIPRLAPCLARAASDPPAAGLCPGGDLQLSGAPSTVENCCQCGGLEYRWLRRDGLRFTVVRDWSRDPAYAESPGPSADGEYKLEVRCSTSRNACTAEVRVPVTIGPPAADAGPDRRVCADGAAIRIGTPARPGQAYLWSPPDGLDDPSAAEPLASPAATTVYTLRSWPAADPACFAEDEVTVTVEPLPGRVDLLYAVRRDRDVALEWTLEATASGGYHVYRTLVKSEIPDATRLGTRVLDTLPSPASNAGDLVDAVPGPGGTLHFLGVVAVCADDVTEGPL